MNSGSTHALIRHRGMTLTWADLNPAEGVFDFSHLERQLEAARTSGGMALFRLKASILDGEEQGVVNRQRRFVPQWVVDKHRPPTFLIGPGKRYVAPWHPGVQAEFAGLVREIGRRGYLASPHFLAIYLHGISASRGEELNIKEETYTRAAQEAGLTPQTLVDCFRARIDRWVEAAGAQIGKVVWVGCGEIKGMPYPREALDDYALSKGLGARGGFIEHYFYGPIHPPAAGQTYVDGHVRVNYGAPLRDGRYFGDENEEDDEFGTASGRELAFAARTPYFRAAQAGINFLWVSAKTIAWAGGGEGIPGWYARVAGKGPKEAPDAACWLREAYVRGLDGNFKSSLPWKNLEHLLFQCDVEGARAVPAERYEMPYVSLKDRQKPHEFTARRTDCAAGQNAIAFSLEPAFRASLDGAAQIKVHFLDNSRARWTVRTAAAGGRTRDLGVVEGRGDGRWKTATFEMPDAFATGALGKDIDFLVRALEGGDVTVRLVRVVRMTPPRD